MAVALGHVHHQGGQRFGQAMCVLGGISQQYLATPATLLAASAAAAAL
jgi:hypothetical protein